MSKLMEVIEKNPDFKNGTASVRLLDTTFSQLTRKIGSKVGSNFISSNTGDMLSKEVLVSLNQEQLKLKQKLIDWQNNYNNYIDSISKKIVNATHFEYNFTSLVDYSSKYIPNKTLADYYLLTEFVNAEKELYEFGHYWGRNHMLDLLAKMKEWSKTQAYGSSVQEVGTEFETRFSTNWSILDNAGLNVRTDRDNGSGHDKCWCYIAGLQNMKLNEKRIVKIGAYPKKTNQGLYYGAFGYIEIIRKSLGASCGTDDGYYTFRAWHKDMDKVRSWPRVTKWINTGSPHFDIKEPTLACLKKVVLL